MREKPTEKPAPACQEAGAEERFRLIQARAYALWEGWFGYDRKKYAAMLREAFEPFVLCVPNRAEPVLLSDSIEKYLGSRLAISFPPFRPSLTAAGSFLLGKIQRI